MWPFKWSSPTKPPTTIEDLPVEMISKLFNHLNLKDLATCSLVNKRWHSIYAGFRVRRLVVIDDYDNYRYYDDQFKFRSWRKWSHPVQKVEQKELCHLQIFNRLVDHPLLSNLKYLLVEANQFDLNKLNLFSRLVHLEIKQGLGEEKLNLNLPSLRVLELHSFSIGLPLFIDCPKLNVLIYDEGQNGNRLELKHPEIRMLVTNMSGAKLTRFRSVECVVTSRFELINKTTLQSLPNLKELHCNTNLRNLWFWGSGVGTLTRVKGTLQKFLKDVRRLRGPDFKFLFAGFHLTQSMLNQIDFGEQIIERNGIEDEEVSNEYVYMKNYQLVGPGALHFIYEVDYSHLSQVSGGIPNCFSQKFNRVERVYVGEVQDESHLLWFLRSLSWLRRLSLDRPELSQEFYDQLPGAAYSLSELTLGQLLGPNWEKKLEVNFDFISKLPSLSKVKIYPIVSFKSLASLVRRSGRLEIVTLNFRLNERKFQISTCIQSKIWKISELKVPMSPERFWTENPIKILNYFQELNVSN